MHRIAIPMHRMREPRNARPRRSNDNGERAVEACFAVLTILILGMVVGIAAYAVRYVIPDLQRLHSPNNHEYFRRDEFKSHSPEFK